MMKTQLAQLATRSQLARAFFVGLRFCWHLLRNVRARFRRPGIRRRYLSADSRKLLQLGAGPNGLSGWLNTDLAPLSREVMLLDACRPFPLPSSAFDAVFSEHQIEHLRMDDGLRMLQESYRVLVPGGRIRLATPDLEALLSCMNCTAESDAAAYIRWMYHRHIEDRERRLHEDTGILPGRTPQEPASLACRIINNAHHNWGHQFLYDEATLAELLEQAGFIHVIRCDPGSSTCEDLRNLECHGQEIDAERINRFETMVLEAEKPR